MYQFDNVVDKYYECDSHVDRSDVGGFHSCYWGRAW